MPWPIFFLIVMILRLFFASYVYLNNPAQREGIGGRTATMATLFDMAIIALLMSRCVYELWLQFTAPAPQPLSIALGLLGIIVGALLIRKWARQLTSRPETGDIQ